MSAVVLATLLAANPFLEQAQEDFRALDYERCLKRVDQASRNASRDVKELSAIELTRGLCSFSLGDEAGAASAFKLALRLFEGADLPAFVSPRAVELFQKVRLSLRAPAAPFPDADLPPDAPLKADLTPAPKEPVLVERPVWKKHPATIALGVLAVAAIGTAIGLGLHANSLAAEANHAQYDTDFRALGEAARNSAIGANVAWVIAGGSLIAAAATLITEPAPAEAAAR